MSEDFKNLNRAARVAKSLNPDIPRGYVTRILLPSLGLGVGLGCLLIALLPQAYQQTGHAAAFSLGLMWYFYASKKWPEASIGCNTQEHLDNDEE
ncbi:MAG: hypothetical protein EA380_03405 [Phycisphaeraceae bacterium]|nr:MAG: hypothetical protein EA380_03405 [Phycisphaeraceae bacterium]